MAGSEETLVFGRSPRCVSTVSAVTPPTKPPGLTACRAESACTHVTETGSGMCQSRCAKPLRIASRNAAGAACGRVPRRRIPA